MKNYYVKYGLAERIVILGLEHLCLSISAFNFKLFHTRKYFHILWRLILFCQSGYNECSVNLVRMLRVRSMYGEVFEKSRVPTACKTLSLLSLRWEYKLSLSWMAKFLLKREPEVPKSLYTIPTFPLHHYIFTNSRDGFIKYILSHQMLFSEDRVTNVYRFIFPVFLHTSSCSYMLQVL